jgi:hypothetical protein
VPHDTSSPAKALIGHWKDAKAMNQYFDGSVWSTVTSGNERWKYGSTVQSESVDKREVVLRTFAIQKDGSTGTDVEVITFHFLNGRLTQIQWGVAAVTADYVGGQTKPWPGRLEPLPDAALRRFRGASCPLRAPRRRTARLSRSPGRAPRP